MPKISLFAQVRSCQDCLFSWEGYASGFYRGHTVMTRRELILFAPDDLIYEVPLDGTIEIEPQLVKLGWRSLESCPKCGSHRLFPAQYAHESLVDVPCLEVTGSDLEQDGLVWKLKESALLRFAQNQINDNLAT